MLIWISKMVPLLDSCHFLKLLVGEQMQTNGTGTLTWEPAGATAFDDIGDPDAATTIAFDDTETVLLQTASDGESWLTLSGTDTDLAADTTFLLITTADNDDVNYIPFEIQDDSGGTPDTLFRIDSTGKISIGIIDGELIADDTIDDDSIDFADVTGADLTLTDSGAITASGLITANANLDIKNGASAGLLSLFEASCRGTNANQWYRHFNLGTGWRYCLRRHRGSGCRHDYCL